ncbi:MAG: hypothetical protein ACR2PX_18900 [Endozoicomonas sp.]
MARLISLTGWSGIKTVGYPIMVSEPGITADTLGVKQIALFNKGGNPRG